MKGLQAQVPDLGMCSVSQTRLSRSILIYQIFSMPNHTPCGHHHIYCYVAHSLAWAAGGNGSVPPVALVWQRGEKEEVVSESFWRKA